jgi:hypothetical protein
MGSAFFEARNLGESRLKLNALNLQEKFALRAG